MRVIQLSAENFKRIKAIDITLSNGVVVLSGRNGEGKSSVSDALWAALGGKEAIPGQPVRKGQDKAKIMVGLGGDKVELVVKRIIAKDGPTSLIIESPEGARYPSPQAMLDDLWNSLAVDPHAFSRMPPKEQAALLRRVAKLDIDVDEIDAMNKADYDLRTSVNRELKSKKTQADAIVVPPEVGSDAVDESALVDELQTAGKVNADIQERAARREAAQTAMEQRQQESLNATARAVRIRADANATHETATARVKEAYELAMSQVSTARVQALIRADEADAEAKIAMGDVGTIGAKLAVADPLPPIVDVTELRQRIAAAKETNRKIDERNKAQADKSALNKTVYSLDEQSKTLTKNIETREQGKAEAIQKAAMPVPGLGFADGTVTYQGIPFDQASQAEQLRVGMAVALAANPKLKVVCIREGSLLDDDSLALVAAMAAEAKAQVILERVDGSGKVGIYIEDGMVVSDPQSREAFELTGAK